MDRRKFIQLTSASSALPAFGFAQAATEHEKLVHGPLIREIHITPIAIVDPPLLNAAGLHAPYALRTILEIVTEDNISGISEIPGSRETDLVLEDCKKFLVGKDVFALSHIKKTLIEAFGKESAAARGVAPLDQRKLVHIFSAVEVACMDIMGKVAGKPIVDLIGGKMRDRVPFAAYLFYKYEGAGGVLGFKTNPNAKGWEAARQKKALNANEIVDEALAMCKEFGFQSLKLKGGVFEPRHEVDAVLALRKEFGPKYQLRIDPNALWKVETAIKYGKELEPVLEYLEDPVRGQENMAKVRKAIKTPLATNMCTTAFEDIPNSIAVGSEDIILMDHHFWGGLRASIDLGAICKTFGRGMSMHSNSHLGISLAAMIHLGAAMPNLKYDLDTHYPWQSDEVIKGGRFRFEGGSVEIPKEPGLGVELDRDALARLNENYKTCGLTRRNDEIEMQKVNPGWKFEAVRW